jgi:catechol 2,3-dioxygenase-like lactoylglutathione lyase family enzyme
MFSEVVQVGITVRDVEENLALYADTLKLKIESDFEVSGSAWEKVTGIPGITCRRITLQRTGIDSGKIVLIKFLSPQSKSFPMHRKPYDLGIYDFGFESFDLDTSYRSIIEKGYKFDSPVQPVIVEGKTVAREASIQAPEGVHVMLAQVLYKPSETQKEGAIISSEMDHVVIVVRDHQKSLRFYRDILGLKPIIETVLEGEELDQIVRVPQAKLKVSLLEKEKMNAGKVEVIQYLSHKGEPLPEDTSLSDCGLRFISFRVDDMDKAYNLLKSEGIALISEPEVVPMGVKRLRMFLAKDFDNIFIEFFQEV